MSRHCIDNVRLICERHELRAVMRKGIMDDKSDSADMQGDGLLYWLLAAHGKSVII